MDALEFLNEFGRMCKYYDRCIDCPATDICDSKCISEISYVDDLIKIVSDWSKRHPRKTRLDDFKEKYPNAETRANGYPWVVPCQLGYIKRCEKFPCDYRPCWDELI